MLIALRYGIAAALIFLLAINDKSKLLSKIIGLYINIWHNIQYSDFLEVETKIEIRNNGLPGKGILKFLSGRKQNYTQFSVFHCSNGNLGVNISI